jgi:hypothetical protein
MRLATVIIVGANLVFTLFTLTVSCSFAFAQDRPYAQSDVVTAEGVLISNAISRIKGVVTSDRLKEVAVWKIEADERKSVDVVRLSTKLNFAFMDAGLLTERAFDFTDIDDPNELKRVAEIYGIGSFVYGKRTFVEGKTIKVSFQVLEASSLSLVWEGMVNSEKPLPVELAFTLYYGKWVSLGTAAGTGVGAITTLALAFDARSKLSSARSFSEFTTLSNQFTSYLGWSIGLGAASVVSGGVAAYLFLNDEGEPYLQGRAFPEPLAGRDMTILLWPEPRGAVVGVYLRF